MALNPGLLGRTDGEKGEWGAENPDSDGPRAIW